MTFRIRHLALLSMGIVIATIGAWFLGFIPLIYLMPIIVLQVFMLSLACPMCGKPPFVRRFGPFLVGWPTTGARCWNCGFNFREFPNTDD